MKCRFASGEFSRALIASDSLAQSRCLIIILINRVRKYKARAQGTPARQITSGFPFVMKTMSRDIRYTSQGSINALARATTDGRRLGLVKLLRSPFGEIRTRVYVLWSA